MVTGDSLALNSEGTDSCVRKSSWANKTISLSSLEEGEMGGN